MMSTRTAWWAIQIHWAWTKRPNTPTPLAN